MSSLLKEKSKVGVINKPRTTYDAYDFLPEKKLRDAQPKENVEKNIITMSSGEKKKIQPKVISKDVTMRDKS